MLTLLPRAGGPTEAPAAASVSPLPPTPRRLTVGLIDNSKAGARVITSALAERLAGIRDVGTRVPVRKTHASLPLSAADHDLLRDVDVVLSALGDCGSCTSWTVKDAVALEASGVPAIVVCTAPFAEFARAQARAVGLPDLRLLVLEHPIAELDDDAVQQRVAAAAPAFDALWSAPPTKTSAGRAPAATPSRTVLDEVELRGPAADEELAELLVQRGISDGLPVVAPTPDRVAAMLAEVTDADEVIGLMPPMHQPVTARALAAVSVMAGCLPAYFPVVAAAVRATLADEFNLNGVQTTTHPCGIFTLVSGPVAAQIGMNCGIGAFGPGNRANATIGRAVRLAQLALGGARPGDGDMATLGSPAKYTFAAAENIEGSPWESLARSRGFAPDDSVVTVIGSEAPQNINDHESKSGLGVLRMIAGTMRTTGANNSYYRDGQVLVVLSPEHARTLADDGYTRADVQQYLWAEARTPIGYFSENNIRQRLQTRFPGEFAEYGAHTLVPIVHAPENVLLTVIGGPGKHSMFVPTFGATRAVSTRVTHP